MSPHAAESRRCIRVVIVDDEPLATTNLQYLLAGFDDVRIAGTAGNATAALETIVELRPDVVFLDVRMPRGSGFDVLRQIPPGERPLVIFVSAYDSHAVEAFDVEAVDYLEKPVAARRLARALDRLRARLDARRHDPVPAPLVQLCGGAQPVFASRDEIIWVEASGRHCLVHGTGGATAVRASMSGLTERLDPGRFVRIHRSRLLHVAHVRQIASAKHGDLAVTVSTGDRVRVSRRYRVRFLAVLGRFETKAQARR